METLKFEYTNYEVANLSCSQSLALRQLIQLLLTGRCLDHNNILSVNAKMLSSLIRRTVLAPKNATQAVQKATMVSGPPATPITWAVSAEI